MPSDALLIHLKAGKGMEEELEAFLQAAQLKARQEADTAAWYAFRSGRGEYGILDAFGGNSPREAHWPGPILQALMMQADTLLSGSPKTQPIDVLASKLPKSGDNDEAAMTKGLLLRLHARAGHERRVEQLLREAGELVKQERNTRAWFALHLAGGEYAMFDGFSDNGARLSHLVGKVPRQLLRHALSLMGGMPEMRLLDMLAHKPAC